LSRDRALGILLFLPVPLVLWLFTRQPLGILPSLGLGALLMLTHPLYARPFALRRARERCLWCGGRARERKTEEGARHELSVRQEPTDRRELPDRQELTLVEPRGTTTWYACRREHLVPLRHTLGYAERHTRFLRAGILGALGVFLLASIPAALRRSGPIRADDAVALFRLLVALTVLPLGWIGPRGPMREAIGTPIRTPFPVHIQALIGTWGVLWLFRLIGILWLIQGIAHFTRR
jgi:hypothetical protein